MGKDSNAMRCLDQSARLEQSGPPTWPLPPLTAIRAFEAAVRLQSFSRAAHELNMTPAAVSYQIKQLEARVDMTLFQRLPRKVILTAAGEQLAPQVLEAFRLLNLAFSALNNRAGGALAITALPSFAAHWLVPRLGRFQQIHPALHLRLDTSVPLSDLNLGAFDISIRSGSGTWEGMDAHFLFPDIYTPLLSPSTASRAGDPLTPYDLHSRMLLGRSKIWQMWFDHAGAPVPAPLSSAKMDFGIEHYDVAAAIAGDGVAIASPLLFAAEIDRGLLVQPFSQTVQSTAGYWLVYPAAAARTPKLRAFTRWLLSEAGSALDAYLPASRDAQRT